MPQIVSLPDYSEPAQRLAQALDCEYAPIRVHRFPDGESQVSVPTEPAKHVIICQSLHRPNDKLIELLLAIRTFRDGGVKRISLVAPYLCYMRQDKAFHPGEAVSQQIVGRFLAELVDDLITVDAHLHRIRTLQQAIPLEHATNLSAASALGNFLLQQRIRPLLLGPDSESDQWVKQVASVGDFDWAVASKQRLSDIEVNIALPAISIENRVVVLVDDVLSSGHTLAEAAKLVIAAGAAKVFCLVTHALFAEGALDVLQQAGVQTIWSSDSIPHESNVIQLADILAAHLHGLLEI
jgi:ribose-phosphate pyrophosphokinase